MGGSNGTMNGGTSTELVLVGADNGVAVVSSDTPLRRLNYFDGKFLRADDMRAEQDYLRFLVQTSNRAGGSGIVNGFDTVLAGGGAAVSVGQGLALDAKGRVLLLSGGKTMKLDDIIAASNAVAPGAVATAAGSADFADCVVVNGSTTPATGQTADLYLLTVGFLEALCGEEDVFGKLCEAACVQSKDRPWRMEGVVFRAVPLSLKTLLEVSKAVPVRDNQLRSRVASAYYADERAAISSLISGVNIRGSDAWCLGAAAEIGDAVPLAVFSRSGGVTHFLDAWTARREHIETPAKRYWAWRFAMRPWDVFLAQVLQFQCQLHDILSGIGDGGSGGDPCATARQVIGDAYSLVARLEEYHALLATRLAALRNLPAANQPPVFEGGVAEIATLRSRLDAARLAEASPTNEILIDGGIVELPSAGYLPVVPGTDFTVNQQVRNLLGDGLDLRFCITTPDYIPHALEEAQHMERISLLAGLDDPTAKPHVDILVPNGTVAQGTQIANGTPFVVTLLQGLATTAPIRGAGRSHKLPSGGGEFYAAVAANAVGALAPGGFIARMMRATPPIAAPVPAGSGSGRDAFRAVSTAGAQARDFANARDFAIGTDAARRKAGAAVDALTSRSSISAMHAALRIERNPFALGANETTPCTARILLLDSAANVALTDERAFGDLRIRTPAVDIGGGAQRVLGFATLSTTVAGTGGSTNNNYNLDVELTQTLTATGGTMRISLQNNDPTNTDFNVILEHSWDGNPLNGDFKQFSQNDPKTPRLEITLVQDASVLQPANELHVLAESSMDLINAKLAEPLWREASEQELFPPPVGPGPDGLDVFATLDWVLFTRRRECSCHADAPAPAPAPARRFQVYWVDGDQLPAGFYSRLMSSTPGDIALIRGLVHPVDIVSFAAGSTVLDQPGAAASDLQSKITGNTLQTAVIAMQDPADPASIEAGRLANYVSATKSVLDITHPDAPLVLPSMPPALMDPNVSGTIVLAISTVEAQEAVFVLKQSTDLPTILKLVTGGSRPVSLLASMGAPLGTARFAPGSSALLPDSDNLPAAWSAQGAGGIASAYAFYAPDVTDPAALLEQRSLAIEGSLVSSSVPTSNPTQLSQANWDLPQAKTALFLLPAPPFLQVLIYRATADAAADPIALLKVGALKDLGTSGFTLVGVYGFGASGLLLNPGQLLADFNAAKVFPGSEGRAFYTGTAADAGTAAQRCNEVLQALNATFSITPEQDNVDAHVFISAPLVMVIATRPG